MSPTNSEDESTAPSDASAPSSRLASLPRVGIAATAVAGLMVLVSVALSGRAGDDSVDPRSQVTALDFENRFFPTYRVGQCLDIDLDDTTVLPGIVVCDEPHTAEVYLVHTLSESNRVERPDDEILIGTADRVCVEGFEAFVGVPYQDSEIDFHALYPSPESWSMADDRKIFCLAVETDGTPVTGSLRGAAR